MTSSLELHQVKNLSLVSQGERTVQKLDFTNDTDCINERISKFPTTRYYGSKRKVLPWIYNTLKDIPFCSVLDCFGGTASVSLLFKAMNKNVTYHDALQFNSICARALLLNTDSPVLTPDIKSFLASVNPYEGVVARNFADLYYTREECLWIDGAIRAICQVNSQSVQDIYYYCLFQACLKKRPFNLFHRANHNLRLNRPDNTNFGNATTWERSFLNTFMDCFEEYCDAVWKSNSECVVLSPSDASSLQCGYDLVYIDPPYLSSDRSHDDYLRRYHFLEGICTYDKWIENIDVNLKCRPLKTLPHIREWQHKTRFGELLCQLIEKHRGSIVVLSYVDNAYPTIDLICSWFNDIFSRVCIEYKEVNRALSKSKTKEVLIIGFP